MQTYQTCRYQSAVFIVRINIVINYCYLALSVVEVNDDNEIAIAAISEKLSEVTILAEQLDTTLCGFKFAMESDSIKKLLETTDMNCQVIY